LPPRPSAWPTLSVGLLLDARRGTPGGGESRGVAARKRATARAAVLPARRGSPTLRGFAPSGRSIAVGIALLLLAVGAYAAALETSVFAVRRLEIVGGSPRAQAEVRAALAPELGRSLLRVNSGEIGQRVASAPDVLSVSFDRSFPHTLRIVVRPERPVLLLRRGNDAWVVSATGRVLRPVRNPKLSSLPRAWVPHETAVSAGEVLGPQAGGRAAAALAWVRGGLFGRIRFVRVGDKELTFVLHTGLELRLGDINDVRLKIAIARRILAVIGPFTTSGYIDVSVPERPVVGFG
jgi:cell division protein FtsQ